MKTLSHYLDLSVERGASDLHITAGQQACYRINGRLEGDTEIIAESDIEQMLETVLSPVQLAEFKQKGTLDFAYSTAAGERFRLNLYLQLGAKALAIRHLPNDFKSLNDLGLPASTAQLAQLKSGLVLVCGATGSGKSTTLATLINEINLTRQDHILTIEDPVEFVHRNQNCLVHQRELHTDVPDFASALRAALREDPDVIMVGEMRDLETIRAALTAAETGHLVFSTLHTSDAVGVIERLVASFPGIEQDVARSRIAQSLQAVVAQHLLPCQDGGRVAAVEILRNNQAVANLIESDKSRQIYAIIEAGREQGMQTIDQALAELVQRRWIALDVAFRYARNKASLEKMLQQRPVERSW